MLGKLFRKNRKKVCVLGIDGVPCSLLRRFIGEGIMPNLARMVEKGTLSEMTASIPEVSSTSWSTFMTGVNPGRHGIFGFMELQKGSYQWKFPNFDDLQSETLWDIAGKSGKRSIVINVPSTYPARKLNGIMTSGFVALDLRKATYPDTAFEYLNSIGYKLDVNTKRAQESSDALAADIKETFEIRIKAILHFLESEQWDMFIGVVTETDRLHHYLWSALDDSSHPQYEFFRRFYSDLDRFIGQVSEQIGDETPLFIISDHGFTAIREEVYLNTWLRQKGYLKFSSETPESFSQMSPESRIFVLDPARFYIHTKERFSNGCVSADEYIALRDELKNELLSLSVDGKRVIRDVYFREDLYSGPLYEQAPDMVALPHEGFDLKGSISKRELTGRSMLTGGHTYGNAVFFLNRKVNADSVNIIDVGPTVLSMIDVDSGFDGRCLV
jgi:predicted AlkP superfamily phosphohydrolase/phosphomutase